MSLKQFTTDFKNIGQQEFLRPNVGYRYFFDVQKSKVYPLQKNIKLKYILKELPTKKLSKGDLGDPEMLIDIGNIERRFNNLINVEEVDNIGSDKTILEFGDIVIPKMQPQMGNIFLNLDHKRYIGSTELLEYAISSTTNPIFLYYLMTTRRFLSDLQKLESGKTHRRVNPIDLLKIKIPYIPKTIQDKIVDQIEPIEKKTRELRAQITPAQEVINKVFAREFKFDLDQVYSVEQNKHFTTSDTFTYRNYELRSSVRWYKIAPIQDVLYKNTQPIIKKLGKFTVETKNGWSPNCKETDSLNFVFGVNNISTNSVINFDDLKTSDETRSDLTNYLAKDGDFFVSRGNTVDLVALASVVVNMPVEKNIIFPDLFIRIDVNEKILDKKYLAYLFNSVIGRFYFKYAAKGKNQTMVKVSSGELNNFYIPVPSLKDQQKIVDEIKAELDKQEEMNNKIESERNKIDEIIENAIK